MADPVPTPTPVKSIEVVHEPAPVPPAPVVVLPKWFGWMMGCMAAAIVLLFLVVVVIVAILLHHGPGPVPPVPPEPTDWPEPTRAKPVSFEQPKGYEVKVGETILVRVKTYGHGEWVWDPTNSDKYKIVSDGVLVKSAKEGEFWLGAYGTVSGDASKTFWTRIKCGKGPLPPPPPSVNPFKAPGFRVLIVYESGSLVDMPADQRAIITGKKARDFLNANCVKGPDGKTPERRAFDPDADMSAESQIWQDVMKRPRTGIPWMAVGRDEVGWEGPLPANEDEAIAIWSKYLPGK